MTSMLNTQVAARARRLWRLLECALNAASGAGPEQLLPCLKNERLYAELTRHRAVLDCIVRHSFAMASGAPLEDMLTAIAEDSVALTGATYGAVEDWGSGVPGSKMVDSSPPGRPNTTSLLAIPIVAGHNVVGRIWVTGKVGAGEFSTEDMHILRVFAAQAGAAMGYARLAGKALDAEALRHLGQLDLGQSLPQN